MYSVTVTFNDEFEYRTSCSFSVQNRNQWQETIPLFQRALNSSGIGGRKKCQHHNSFTRCRSATRTKSNFEVLVSDIFHLEALSNWLSLGKDLTVCRFSRLT